jgi:hypothetical protein
MKITRITSDPFSQRRRNRQIPAIGKPWSSGINLCTEAVIWLDGPVTSEFSASVIESDDRGGSDPASPIIAFPRRHFVAPLDSTGADFVQHFREGANRFLKVNSSANKGTLILFDFKERKRINPR